MSTILIDNFEATSWKPKDFPSLGSRVWSYMRLLIVFIFPTLIFKNFAAVFYCKGAAPKSTKVIFII